MKITALAGLAALAGSAAARNEVERLAVLRFGPNPVVKSRQDPIVSPGKVASHVHTVLGSSGFSMNATAEDLMNADCTSANIKGDQSSYWFPSLYFYDAKTREFESVEYNYANVYYFFEKTMDEIKAFPPGLQIVAGDPWTRTAPKVPKNSGARNGAMVTCPRLNNNYSPASWHEGSDGSDCGIPDPATGEQGYGFPDVTCDGQYSPLRADVHFPSCYNPEAGLTDKDNNMKYPENEGGYLNCPPGWIHVPHLFMEVYWSTDKFKGRWTEGQKEQPFVLSNGDVTGFSLHADFMAGWDEKVLQNIIDTCDAGTIGMDHCPGVTVNKENDCTIEDPVGEDTVGPFSKLPGNNPLLGWSYGTEGLEALKPNGNPSAPAPSSSPSKPDDGNQPETPKYELPEVGTDNNQAVENAEKPKEPAPEPVAEQPATSCDKKVHTVMETFTVTEEVEGVPTEVARRHLHGHQHGHHRRGFH